MIKEKVMVQKIRTKSIKLINKIHIYNNCNKKINNYVHIFIKDVNKDIKITCYNLKYNKD